MFAFRTIFAGLIAAPLLAAACGSDNGNGSEEELEPITDRLDSFETESGELAEAVTDHGEVVSGAADLDEVLAAEADYSVDAEEHHLALHHEIEDMTACHEGSVMLMAASLEEALERIEEELDDHATAMASAADLDAALSEEDSHQQSMEELFEVLDTEFGSLSEESESFMCPHHADTADDHHA